jgi:hypothetical protein
MARVAAIAWVFAAILIAGLVSYLASEEPSSCGADPTGAAACAPPIGQAVATIALWSFLVPVWAPPLLCACLMARRPSRELAFIVAAAGIVGGAVVAVAIVLLTHPSGPPSWDAPWLSFALLLGVPGLVSGLAAREVGSGRAPRPRGRPDEDPRALRRRLNISASASTEPVTPI